jgi:hypothetical protein
VDALEEVSDIIHEFWQYWSTKTYNRMTGGWTHEQFFENWSPHWMPYEKLDEETKELERRWAKQILTKLHELGYEIRSA